MPAAHAPLFDKCQRYTPLFDKIQRHTHRYSTNVSRIHTAIRQKSAAEQAAIRQVLQLFDKHDKYVNRNRHDFMFFNDAVATYVAGLT